MKRKLQIMMGGVFLLLLSCADDVKTERKSTQQQSVATTQTKDQNLNISFLLDLSDRIDPKKYPNATMQFYQRDIAYIKSVSEAFLVHLKNKKVRTMNDKIQLYFDPEPKNKNINQLSNSLRFNITKANASLEILDQIQQEYTTKPQLIYEAAIQDNEFVGSDTWRFFKNKINDLCMMDDHRNILIILTDGYIYHKNTVLKKDNKTSYLTPQLIRNTRLNTNSWEDKLNAKGYGFMVANENLSQLEILVLGINPDEKNPHEQDVIHTYWKHWFDEMNVDRYEIKTAILPANMDKIIKDFILQKDETK